MMNGIWLGWLLGLALIFLLVWAVIRAIANSGLARQSSSDSNDVEILRQRIARGEIGEQTFKEKQQLLEKSFAQEK